MLQSDRGESIEHSLIFLNQNIIIFKHSRPYTYHQNGVVERKHRHIVELGLTLLAQAKLPLNFLWEAFQTSVYRINKLLSATLKFLTPYEKLFNYKPDYTMLQCFVCVCYLYLRDYKKYKFAYHLVNVFLLVTTLLINDISVCIHLVKFI